MQTPIPTLESAIDDLVIFPYDSDRRKLLRDMWDAANADVYPVVIKRSAVLRASLLALSGDLK